MEKEAIKQEIIDIMEDMTDEEKQAVIAYVETLRERRTP